ncbi:VirB4 family type IV secretion system protein [Halorientalis brevis]|uniref:VirB4 family type IV secretion system protein n=1 Tax=Halorientalis brevis TaxID=1126241 RepID=A0ABD6CEF0_9EURY|nr:hypothetical protein [Halorientalis brevis]
MPQQQIDRDPTQVVPPYVNTGIKLGPIPAAELVLVVPGVLVAVAGLFLLSGMSSALVIALGVLLALTAFLVVLSSHDFTSPRDKLYAPRLKLKNWLQLPMSHETAAEETVHGVEQIHSNGFVKMADGRLVGLVRLHGRNTDKATESELNLLVGQLAKGIDEDIKDFNFEFYSTTSRVDPAEITEPYRKAANSEELAGPEWFDLRNLLYDIDQWHEEQETVWQPRKWRHYVRVEVKPEEVSVRKQTVQSRGRRLLELFVPFLTDDTLEEQKRRKKMVETLHRRLSTLEHDVFSPIDGVSVDRVSPEELAALVADKWTGTEQSNSLSQEQVCTDSSVSTWPHIREWMDTGDVPDHVEGDVDLESTQTGPVTVRSNQPGGKAADGGATQVAPEEDSDSDDQSEDESDTAEGGPDRSRLATATQVMPDRLLAAVERIPSVGDEATTADGANPEDLYERHQSVGLQDRLAPESYDIDTGFVRVGDQFCKTFWLASWPANPESMLLQDLYTIQGVDVDVNIKCRPRDRASTIHELEHLIAEIDAEAVEREAETDVSSVALTDDLDTYMTMYKLLQQSNTQPWDINAYVTVRVGNEAALDKAEERIDELLDDQASTMDLYKIRALDEKADQVHDILESKPADMMALAPASKQKLMFESCGPVGRDVYDDNSFRNRYRMTLGGTPAATFPPATRYMQEDSGVEYGRSVQNGTVLKADPFNRGGAPHQLTIAPSGSGKTYAVGKRALRWWAADPGNRTLILCDTMGGFDDIVDLCNGEHIVVDGADTINPLDVEEPPEAVLENTDISVDPFRMAVDSGREFIARIVSISGPDPDKYSSTIEECIEHTFIDHGITPDDIEVDEQPTLDDFIETAKEMARHPGRFTMGDTEREKEHKAQQAAELLDYLSGFKETGKYNHLRGETEVSIDPGEVTYLDLQQIEGQGDADKSAMLHLMLTQAYQTVKRAPGQTMFVIDEAHYLLHSDEMVQWLQRAARHWRHHDAMMWFVSQDPDEFVATTDQEADSHRETITGQCSTVEFFNTPKLDREIARDGFGMNEKDITFVKQDATPGEAGVGYTEALVDFRDVEGWLRTLVQASPIEDEILSDDDEDEDE